jgi:AmmeMemoRadiSam system protein B
MEAAERAPAVAGSFYSSDPAELERFVRETAEGVGPACEARAVVVPHAGYVYSGRVAGRTFASVRIPDAVIVACVDHYGRGPDAAISTLAWRTPLGRIAPDLGLAEALRRRAPWVEDDPAAHAAEHSLEVQLPFLQVLKGTFRFLPLQVRTHDAGRLRSLGEALAGVVEEAGEPVLLVASTDLTHYLPDPVARAEDRYAVERILAVDGEGLLRTVKQRRMSVCGVAPTTAVLMAAHRLGARRAEEVVYATSADAGGDKEAVVGYVGCRVL